MDPSLKQMKIRTGVVKRLCKEKFSYEKEAEMMKERVETMKTQGKDPYDIKKQSEVLQESLMMVPDCIRRLKTAHQELKVALDSASNEARDSEEFRNAELAWQEADKVIEAQCQR